MAERRSTTVVRYTVAVVSICLATVLRVYLDPTLGDRFPFATLFFAVLVSAGVGGFGPALLASALGSLLAAWYLLPPGYSLAMQDGADQAGIILYVAVSLGIALIGGAMRRARRRAEVGAANLAAQREELRVTLESIGDAVVTTDIDGRVTSMNKVASELTGWRAEETSGRPLDEVVRIVNEDTGEPSVNPVRRVLAEGRVVGLANHTLLIARDGSMRPIDDSAAPIRDRNGTVTGVVLVFRDASESRQAHERLLASERELSDFFENANVALHFVGPDGIILRANQAELDMLGYSREEYLGHPIAEFHADAEVIADILDRLGSAETLHGYPARLRCKDGSIKDVVINSSVCRENGRFLHTRCFTLDVTTRRRVEEAQALLAAVVESSDDAIISKALDGHIVSWNAGAERLFGYSATEAIGQSMDLIIPPERRTEEDEVSQRLLNGERIEPFETVRRTRGGHLVDVSVRMSPICDASGRIVGVSRVSRDITARKRTERAVRESEERFRALATNAPAAIFIKDLAGRYTLANPLACEALGRPGDAVGLTDHDMLPAPVADDLRRRDSQVIAGGQALESEEVIRRPGYDRRFLSVKFPLFSGERPVGVCGVAIDITDRKRAEEAVVAADRRKDAFLATLAHELRNPLAPLRNSIEIMKRADGDGTLVARAQATMDRQMSHLERLVDDLVDIARISRDQIELRREHVDLASVIHHAVETCRPLAEAHQLQLDVSPAPDPIHLDADPVRLAQVFSNLLNNSCKYTQAGGRIDIAWRRDGGDAVISVRDTGFGIPTDMLTSIFEMFTQFGEAPEATRAGLGIGLTLVRRLVEMHGGTVVAHSDGPGHGSEFVVRIPLLADPIKPPAPPPPEPTAAIRRRVLVVDDNVDAAESLATLLEMSGHEAHLAHDGAQGLTVAEHLRPDVILLDIGLPKMNGHDVARRIRAAGWGREMVLVALTGWGQEEDRRRSRDVGFDHHLVKPVDVAALMRLLGTA